MKKIKLTQNKRAIVDDEDYPYLNRFKWRATGLDGNKSVKTSIMSKRGNGRCFSLPMVNFLIPRKRNFDIVHKNKNPLDNRKSNLIYMLYGKRTHTGKKSLSKGGVIMTSKYKGVCYKKDNTVNHWQAMMDYKKKRYYIGCFKTEKEAALAYNKKAKELYGEFAYQNKI